jgi:hypothetical protein
MPRTVPCLHETYYIVSTNIHCYATCEAQKQAWFMSHNFYPSLTHMYRTKPPLNTRQSSSSVSGCRQHHPHCSSLTLHQPSLNHVYLYSLENPKHPSLHCVHRSSLFWVHSMNPQQPSLHQVPCLKPSVHRVPSQNKQQPSLHLVPSLNPQHPSLQCIPLNPLHPCFPSMIPHQ